jgi:UDPglucose 6-dehydrogenase
MSSATVLIRSTVPVGTGDELQTGPLKKFRVVANPEFLRESHAIADSLRPERIVAGGDPETEATVRGLYEPIITQRFGPVAELVPSAREVPLLWMDRRSAELAKYAANAFLATKISYINEIANIAAMTGANIFAITEVLATDSRIGPHFLRPGIGWGGSCFPKDTRALSALAAKRGHDFTLLNAVIEQNNKQLDRFFDLMRREIGREHRAQIGLLGLAFKADTSDCRESQGVALAAKMIQEGWDVAAYDPAVRTANPYVPDEVRIVDSIGSAAENADALVVATEWPEFARANWGLLKTAMKSDMVFDGRCIVSRQTVESAGLRYFGAHDSASKGDS